MRCAGGRRKSFALPPDRPALVLTVSCCLGGGAHALATGTSIGQATSTLQTAERLEHFGRTAEAVAKGTRPSRTAAGAIRRAVEARDPECVVEGCTVRDQLDVHHLVPWVEQPVTTVDGVVRICHWEHYLVTHCGYTLEPISDGTYRLVSPDEAERGPP